MVGQNCVQLGEGLERPQFECVHVVACDIRHGGDSSGRQAATMSCARCGGNDNRRACLSAPGGGVSLGPKVVGERITIKRARENDRAARSGSMRTSMPTADPMSQAPSEQSPCNRWLSCQDLVSLLGCQIARPRLRRSRRTNSSLSQQPNRFRSAGELQNAT